MSQSPATHRWLRSAAALAAVLALAAVPAFAQRGGAHGRGPGAPGAGFAGAWGGPGGGHRLERLADALDLTEAQIASAKQVWSDARQALAPIHEQGRALHEQLGALLEDGSPDATAVGELVIAAHRNRQQGEQVMDDAHRAFEALLTPAQLEKLEALQQMRPRRGHRHGPRGDGPGDGPGDDA